VAHNRGLTKARGEIVAFTDDDVVVDSLWLIELARAFEFADDVACVTGLILPMELETPAQFWLENSIRYNKGYAGGPATSGLHFATACRRSQRPRGLCRRWRTPELRPTIHGHAGRRRVEMVGQRAVADRAGEARVGRSQQLHAISVVERLEST
jgi:hypothetical protein